MKVCILTNNLVHIHPNFTGSDVQIANLACTLSKHKYSVSIAYSNFIPKPIPKTYRNVILQQCKIDLGYFKFPSCYKSYIGYLNSFQPDIVYTRGRSMLTFIASSWAGKNSKKHVWASNGEDACNRWKRIGKLRRSNKSFLKKILLLPGAYIEDSFIHKGIKHASTVINQTKQQQLKLKSTWKKHGCILPSIYTLPYATNHIKKKKQILWLAGLKPQKQPEIFIQLAKDFQHQKDFQFVLIGGTDNSAYQEKIHDLANGIQNLTIVGFVPVQETVKWFTESLVYINTSLPEAEGFPNTFLQAWFSKAVVLSLHHNPNDLLSRNEYGFYANGKLNILHEHLGNLLANISLSEKTATKSFDYATINYKLELVEQQYLDLFKS